MFGKISVGRVCEAIQHWDNYPTKPVQNVGRDMYLGEDSHSHVINFGLFLLWDIYLH